VAARKLSQIEAARLIKATAAKISQKWLSLIKKIPIIKRLLHGLSYDFFNTFCIDLLAVAPRAGNAV